MRHHVFAAVAVLAVGCAEDPAPTGDTEPAGEIETREATDRAPLPAYFDCLADKGLTQIAAHRGGPDRGYPENALATLQRTWSETGAFLEVDVATSADGVLFLHHDEYLERTTTGRGRAADTGWGTLRDLSLKDPAGRVTAYGLTRLDEALTWAKGRAVLELDIKRGTDYDDVARIVRETGTEGDIILIAYSDGQAIALSKRFPNSMISVDIEGPETLDRVIAAGLRPEQIVGWTGYETPDPALKERLQSRGIEAIFGTLGGQDSLDRQYERDGTAAPYSALSEMGVELIATDRPFAAHADLSATQRLATNAACPAS